MGDRYNIGFTANGTTGAIAVGAWTKALTPGPVVIPATGNYFHSCTVAATTMPQLVCTTAVASVPLTFYNDTPVWSTSHVNGTTNNTAPGTNPATSAGTTTQLRSVIYSYST
jgi:hypothetical protein